MTTTVLNGFQGLDGLAELVECVRTAGEAILEIYDGPLQGFGVQTKHDKTPVTRADLESHQILTRGLAKLMHRGALTDLLSSFNINHAMVVSEEDPENHPSAVEAMKRGAAVFFVDPLDGTREFIERTGQFVINIGLTLGFRAVFGLIYVPVTDELLIGKLDLDSQNGSQKGVLWSMRARQPGVAQCVETALHQNILESLRTHSGQKVWGRVLEASVMPLPRARKVKVLLSAGHVDSEREIIERASASFVGPAGPSGPCFVPRFVPMGSALKFCRIADQSADVYVRRTPTYAWDTVAGQAIVEASGGWVCSLGTSTSEALRVANFGTLKNPGFAAFGKGFEPEFASQIIAAFGQQR